MDARKVGAKIAELRKRKGFSQDGLAYLCKIDVRTVQRIETGRVRPRPYTLKLLSDVLGCALAELMGGGGTTIRDCWEAFKRGFKAFRLQKGEKEMKNENVLQQLARSRKDRKIAGICGGLGEHTDVPSWFWRLAFIASVFIYGSGVIAYVLLWIFMPKARDSVRKGRKAKSGWLQQFSRSTTDKKLGGICGGLGKNTTVPSWCWRIAFIILVFFHGVGIILYLLMWISTPKADQKLQQTGASLAGGSQTV
jgi:phage shock protein PspC (stress-responsive transcriptional regulator)/DNA-binding XRE family transcriptional regulator